MLINIVVVNIKFIFNFCVIFFVKNLKYDLNIGIFFLFKYLWNILYLVSNVGYKVIIGKLVIIIKILIMIKWII